MPDWDEFEWDEDNEAHIAEHDVDPYEAEEAATDSGAVFRRRGKDRFGNPRYLCVGKTEDGRILFLVVDLKRSAGGGLVACGTPCPERGRNTGSATDEHEETRRA